MCIRDRIGEITEYVQEEAGYGTNLIWGCGHDTSLGEKISVTLIATGFKTAHVSDEAVVPDEQVRIPLDNSRALTEENGFAVGMEEDAAANTIDFEPDDVRRTIEELNQQSDLSISRSAPPQRREATEKPAHQDEYQHMEQARRSYMRRNLALSLDNPKTINDMENEPAYKRRNVTLDDTKEMKARADLSRFEIGADEDEPLQRSGNSYLHENVD